jgi:hypothetical protein
MLVDSEHHIKFIAQPVVGMLLRIHIQDAMKKPIIMIVPQPILLLQIQLLQLLHQ